MDKVGLKMENVRSRIVYHFARGISGKGNIG